MGSTSDQNISVDTVIARSVEQVSCEIDGEIVALSVGKGRYYQMDRVGSLIWDELCEPMTVGNLRDRMMVRFEVDGELCLSDILSFLVEMLAAGLIERNEVSSE
ncbi:PqqD family peptide modification chaperone [Pelagicoccus sp. SDUM812002]|uniref:PqqD family peptide modification chaperone n=1 Tax=Pelagicoccus sp. SDUM812002 TaxID=3041266 RepID=UPI00280DE0EA|nr:PqqD family peptide modification chaperone [Pelagicoccus sp. SDUM812002]MDQ8186269.1 PqqD family peptide modification chaperone [Pelagicoccus sp. SDUM812002]